MDKVNIKIKEIIEKLRKLPRVFYAVEGHRVNKPKRPKRRPAK